MLTLDQMRERIEAWANAPSSVVTLTLTAAQAVQLHDYLCIADENIGGDLPARQLMELVIDGMPAEFHEFFRQAADGVRVCRVCNCTDMRACPEGCEWVEEDLCSACAGVELVASPPLWLPERVR